MIPGEAEKRRILFPWRGQPDGIEEFPAPLFDTGQFSTLAELLWFFLYRGPGFEAIVYMAFSRPEYKFPYLPDPGVE